MKFLHLLLSVSSIYCQCSNQAVRREIRELSTDEFNKYVAAVKSLHSGDLRDGLSRWEAFARLHNEAAAIRNNIHGSPAFLPWHRKFIREYELELQKHDSSVVLPYWDWSIDADYPHLSPVLTPLYMGGNGARSANFELVEGPFANTTLKYPSEHKLSRSYDRGDSLSSYSSVIDVNAIIAENTFSRFAQRLEVIHGTPHWTIGGNYDLAVMTSPNDPLFFLHHAFIDLIWSKWQQQHTNANQYEGQAFNQDRNPNDRLHHYNVPVSSTFDTSSSEFCYSYPEYPRSISPARTNSRSRTQLTFKETLLDTPIVDETKGKTFSEIIEHLKSSKGKNSNKITTQGRASNRKIFLPKITPMPQQWLKSNGLDENTVKKVESDQNEIRQLLDE